MVPGEYGKMEIAEYGGRTYARLMMVMGPYAAQDADILRKSSETSEPRPVDVSSIGGEPTETLLLPSGDAVTVISKNGSPFAFCIDLLLDGSAECTGSPVFHTIWSPREFFEDSRKLMSEHGELLCSEDVDPRKSGEPYHFMDRFRIPASCDEVEVFYLDKGRRRIGDVRYHLRLS